ncbi:MFS transporter [Rhodovibrionaceae bacterium A322]
MDTAAMANRFGGIGLAFSSRNFRVYSLGAIGSWTSYFVQLLAVAWLTWELTGSTLWLAIMALLDIVPNILLMPFAGVLADRYDRWKLMIVTSFLLLLQAGAVALLAWSGDLTLWRLAALVLLHGVLISFMVPAMYGTLPRFIDRATLPSAIAVSSSYTQLAFFAGPAFGGWLISNQGVPAAFLVNALGYLLLLATFLCLKTPAGYQQPTPAPRRVFEDIKNGFSYISSDRKISSLLLLSLTGSAVAVGFSQMLPAFAAEVLARGIWGVSLLLAAKGLGATFAALWLAYGGPAAVRFERAIWSSLIALLIIALIVQVETFHWAAVLCLFWGFASETTRTSAMAVIQLRVQEDQRGRVMGTSFMISQGGAAVGTYLIGTLALHQGLKLPVTLSVAVAVFCWLWVYFRRLRHVS